MLEREIVKDTGKRLRILGDNLSRSDTTCTINLMGVKHDGEPGKDILNSMHQADVVTLELTRGVVHAGLGSENSQLLGRNSFWKTIIKDLKKTEGKMVRGIEINQTPRIAWKRFSLFRNDATLAASYLTFAVDQKNCFNMDNILDRETAENVRQNNWAFCDNNKTLHNLFRLTESVAVSDIKDKLPLQIAPGLSLVCINNEDKAMSVTLITPPHPSVVLAYDKIRQALRYSKLLYEKEIEIFGSSIIMNYFLTLSELTDVKEIAYFANQYTRQTNNKRHNFDVLHIGGSYHTPVMASIFNDLNTDTDHIKVKQSYDTRVPLTNSLYNFFSFPLDFIHYRDRVAAIKTINNDVEMQPDLISRQVYLAIKNHLDEYVMRINKVINK